MNELQKALSHLSELSNKASQVESLFHCTNCGQGKDGYAFLEGEVKKMLDGVKESAVSNKILGDPHAHASLIGAYNALNSLLNNLRTLRENGPKAAAQIQELRKENAEEIDRLGL